MKVARLKWLSSAGQYFISKRFVSKLSPLAQVFNSQPYGGLNFKKDVGLFRISGLSEYNGFYLLQEQVESEVETLLKEINDKNRSRKLVEIFDELSDCLCQVCDMADCVQTIHPDPSYTQAAEETCVKLSGLVERLNTNTEIYSSLKSVLQHGDKVPTDNLDRRIAELFLFDFEQSGIHLSEDKRSKFVQLNEQIWMVGRLFMQGCQKPSSAEKKNLPDHIKHCFSWDGNNVTINSLYSEHYSGDLREAAYKIFLQPDKSQSRLLESLLTSRHQLANLVGFPTYAHRTLVNTMLETPETVKDFLETLSERLQPSAQKDFKKLLKIKQQSNASSKSLSAWDPAYYSAVGRNKEFNINIQDILPYFSIGSCMDGLNNLFQSLYGVCLKHIPTDPGEIWSNDVHKVAVIDEDKTTLGYIYCDFFERPEKPNQDCHYTIQGGRQKSDGSYQLPIVVIQLNLPSPQNSQPSLLTPSMIDNLFHEFGHAMHSMLGRTKYQHVSGTRCSTDFAEVPSVLMEYFVNDPRVLSTFARHYKTGEKLSPDIIRKICQSKSLFSASETQLQVFYSMVDQTYHGKHPLGQTPSQILGELQNKYYSIPYVQDTAWQLRFGHLVGYGAKYYSYLMSKAVSSTIWYNCFYKDPFNRTMGDRFRYKMLVHGGGKHPTELVQDMLNESPTVDKLVDSLIYGIDASR